jgi:DNA-binding CsgD family transcriptional regulator
MPGRWRRVRQDLQAGQVVWVEGPAVCQVMSGLGLIATQKHYVTVADRRFRVSATAFGRFRAHDCYRAYLLPRSGLLVGAVRLAPPEAGSGKIGAAAQPAPARGPSPAREAVDKGPAGGALNSREREILRLAAAGLSNKEIAGRLAFSVNTVKAYLSNAYAKLGVRRRTEAVARARELGVLGDDQE